MRSMHTQKVYKASEKERRSAHGVALCAGAVLFILFAGYLNQITDTVLFPPTETARADEPSNNWGNDPGFGGDGGGGCP